MLCARAKNRPLFSPLESPSSPILFFQIPKHLLHLQLHLTQIHTMGIIRTFLNTAILGGAGAAGGFAFWTRNSKFVPISPADAIFSSPAYLRNNPNKNPATQDLCVRKVPLSKIKPQLLEKEGKLTEAFCAGVWGGLGKFSLSW